MLSFWLSTLATNKMPIWASLQKTLEELREMEKDIDRKNEEVAAIVKMQAAEIAELEATLKKEKKLRKGYADAMEAIRLRERERQRQIESGNDPSASKRTARLKELVAYWKEQAEKKQKHIGEEVVDDDKTEEV
ncbi:hypothetical protein JRO89_XS02G0002700 [Xanthoceras sorbifolium]|uniref:Uncharacterized protein n=1 Tax=Xanthoceras sorbifolium TaxID=99658 RepID=A0ABQ8IDP7_9ROSI|nr:hypothetical protein JRO89_XS02G0002700 [Xanthoceras sorbifolium]